MCCITDVLYYGCTVLHVLHYNTILCCIAAVCSITLITLSLLSLVIGGMAFASFRSFLPYQGRGRRPSDVLPLIPTQRWLLPAVVVTKRCEQTRALTVTQRSFVLENECNTVVLQGARSLFFQLLFVCYVFPVFVADQSDRAQLPPQPPSHFICTDITQH